MRSLCRRSTGRVEAGGIEPPVEVDRLLRRVLAEPAEAVAPVRAGVMVAVDRSAPAELTARHMTVFMLPAGERPSSLEGVGAVGSPLIGIRDAALDPKPLRGSVDSPTRGKAGEPLAVTVGVGHVQEHRMPAQIRRADAVG